MLLHIRQQVETGAAGKQPENRPPLLLKNGKESFQMKVIGILLVILGIIGILMGMLMFGDIGIACMVGALSALLSGIGFIIANGKISNGSSR